jgi:hypothetical protein
VLSGVRLCYASRRRATSLAADRAAGRARHAASGNALARLGAEDTGDPVTLGGDGAEAVFCALNAPTGGGDQPWALYHAVKRLHDERLRQKS